MEVFSIEALLSFDYVALESSGVCYSEVDDGTNYTSAVATMTFTVFCQQQQQSSVVGMSTAVVAAVLGLMALLL